MNPCHSNVPSDVLDAALEYASQGLCVIPLHSIRNGKCTCRRSAGCGSPGKHPRTANGVHDASRDRSVIRAWWQRWLDANVGIATGAESGLVVLDIDPRNGGDESFTRLGDMIGALPVSVRVRTGGGGFHLYLEHPNTQVRNRTLDGLPGIDIKGDGGYVVAPPSVHASGQVYRFANQRRSVPLNIAEMRSFIAPVPTGLDVLMHPPRAAQPQASAVPPTHSGRYGQAALLRQFQRVLLAREGDRNNVLNQAAYSLGQLVAHGVLTVDAVKEALTRAGLQAGLGCGETVATISSGLEAGMRQG